MTNTIPAHAAPIECGQCGAHLRSDAPSFLSDLTCSGDCGHRLNMVDIQPEAGERTGFDADGFLWVWESKED